MKQKEIITQLQLKLPRLLGIYAFGSRIQGTVHANSDLDLAVLVEGYADPVQLWQLAQTLVDLAGCEVDLLDLRAASTVMQYQVITTGELWWSRDSQAELYETFIISEKMRLDEARAPLLEDIYRQGRIYGQ
ncbi:type VII toxin-antitoxin system MntA family adenylyltransferase antitoxin [Nitrincola tapanii]|uniref:Nucleotidyltransferase domain-containing protein n=1 Tax=Nitrincola tapanii TaxID=1708751 RepID=A0A5A9W732_9GAMM|nr:nucleotidyltransferase domain-containing protein [Nitrincola tapanii]KAA0876597.1 nucleotidyltransferase domain-containing protein [Nitrincola tapanii]